MDHTEAVRLSIVEKYLLNELSPQMRDAFEEHYFDCKECVTDLQATTAFMDAARQELKSNPVERTASPVVINAPAAVNKSVPQPIYRKRNPVYLLFQRPAVIGFALAASLLVIIYQNVIVYPGLKTQVAELHSPAILPTVSLAGANSRGDAVPALTVEASHPFLLQFDIPADDRFPSYSCELQSPSGVLLWSVPVTKEAAKDLVTIHAPAVNGNSGRYLLIIKGNSPANSGRNSDARSIELARDAFDLSLQP